MNVEDEIVRAVKAFGIRKDDYILVHAGVREIIKALEFTNESEPKKIDLVCEAFHRVAVFFYCEHNR